MKRGDKALLIRGLQARIDDITEAGRKADAEAYWSGKPYNIKEAARKRCLKKRRLRARIRELEGGA